jgi:nicotinamidase-related amidase
MTGSIPRDSATDHVLNPANTALILIDYQPRQISNVSAIDRNWMLGNLVALVETAKLFDLPIMLSTVNMKTTGGTIPQLQRILPDAQPVDWTTINAWQDPEFRGAVERTNRRKLIIAALWTEACLLFPTLDTLSEGFEVYPATDCVGGTSVEAHERAIERMVQAGARPTTWVSVACELQRDRAHTAAAKGFAGLLAQYLASFGTEVALDEWLRAQGQARPHRSARPERQRTSHDLSLIALRPSSRLAWQVALAGTSAPLRR